MPKGNTVTFEIEPRAVAVAAHWLFHHDPYAPGRQGLFIASLTEQQRAERQAEYQLKVQKAVRRLVKWLERNEWERLEKPTETFNLCLPREMTKWLGSFEPASPRRGGIFGSSARVGRLPASMPEEAARFFFRCRLASSRKMGRPRLTPDQAARRLDHDKLMADSSWHRLVARRDGKDAVNLAALLSQMTIKKPPDFLG